MKTRKELLASKGYWRAKLHIALWSHFGRKKSNKWEKVANQIVDDAFMETVHELSLYSNKS